jgi:hypothetical protein
MKTTWVLLFLVSAASLVACNKDKFQTKPQLKLKSVSTDVVAFNSPIRFRIEFTDKEGDVQDSFFVRKIRLNKRAVPTNLDSFWTLIPDFPNTDQGEFVLDLNYQSIISAINPPNVIGSNPPVKESDSIILKFLAIDNAGNKSDTLTTKTIVVQRQ